MPDSLHLGFFLMLQSSTQFGLLLLASDLLHLDLPLSSQQRAQTEFSFPTLGHVRVGLVSFLPAADCCNTELPVFLHGASQTGLLVLTSDSCFDPMLSLHSLVKLGLSPSHSGRVECDALRALPVVGFAMLDFSLFPQSSSCLDSATAVLGFAHIDPLLSLHTRARLDLPSAVINCRASSAVPIFDACSMDSLFSTRSFSHLAMFLPVLNSHAVGLFLPVQNLFCTGLSSLLVGSRGFAPSILDFSLLDISLLSRSHACPELPSPIFSVVNLGFFLPPQSFSSTESPMLPAGVQRVGPVFFASILQAASLDILPSLRGLAQFDPSLLALDVASLDAGLLLQSICRAGLVSSLGCSSRPGFPSLVPSCVQLGFLLLLKGLAQLDSSVPVMTSLIPGPPLPLRSPSKGGAATPTLGFGRLDLSMLILDRGHLGPCFSPKSTCRPNFSLLACKIGALDFSFLILDVSNPDPAPFLQRFARIGFLLAASSSGLHFDLFSASQNVL